jgi:Fanconi anaemia protein FancD2 nuclease
MLESCIKKTTERIVQLLKKLQGSTRFLHRLVCQSKVNEDKAIIGQIPHIRQVVEANIYRVKAALVANNLSSAFYMGSLKNRDAQGVVIQSQVVPEDVSRNESNETAATTNGEDVIPDQTNDDELEEAMLAIHEGDGDEEEGSRQGEEDDEDRSRADESVSKAAKRRRRKLSSL